MSMYIKPYNMCIYIYVYDMHMIYATAKEGRLRHDMSNTFWCIGYIWKLIYIIFCDTWFGWKIKLPKVKIENKQVVGIQYAYMNR